MFSDWTPEGLVSGNGQVGPRELAQHYLDIAEVMMIALDPRGIVTYANRKSCDVLNAPDMSRLLGCDWFGTFVPEDARGEVRRIFNQLVAGKIEPVEYHENTVLTCDGQRRAVAWHNAVLRDADGRIVSTLSTGQDITELKRAREEIERLARFPAENPNPVLRIKADGDIVYSNPAGAPICRLIAGSDHRLLPKWKEFLDSVFASGEILQHEIALQAGVFDSDWVAVPNAGYVNVYCRDITHLKNAQAQIERLARFPAENPNPVLRVSSGGEILYCNDAASEICGHISDKSDHLLPEWKALLDDLFASDSVQQREVSIEGRVHLCDWVPVPGANYANVYCRDITHQRAVEAQLRQAQKLEAIGQLAGGVAHDFNNIITGILGFAGFVLREFDASSQAYQDMQEVIKLADRAGDLTRQLLAFGRRQTLDTRLLDLNKIVTSMTRMLERLLGENIDLAFHPAADLGGVMGDVVQVEQIILNLAVNARDAMPDGGKLTIETVNATLDKGYAATHEGVEPGEYVALIITDDGIGMDAETRAHIFEPFFTTKGLANGTGLGLATVYGIVKQHGGDIWVYSEPGEGTSFKIYLRRTEERPSAVEGEETGVFVSAQGRTVLLVEDDASVREVGERYLSYAGYELFVAGSGAEARDLFARHGDRIDLLVTDVILPDTNGRALYEQLAAHRPGLPVLYTSGYTDNAIVHHGVLDEGVLFLQKPYTRSQLLTKAGEALSR